MDYPAKPCCSYSGVGLYDVYSEINTDTRAYKLKLGIEEVTLTQEDAIEHLLAREFPDLKFEDGMQKRVLFTPPFFVHKRMDLDELEPSAFKQLKEKFKSGFLENIEADNFEAYIFYSFKEYLAPLQNKNITVIQGWQRSWSMLRPSPPKGPGDEHDLIIIDGERKLIILLEAKMSLTPSAKEKAIAQLLEQKTFFQHRHGHVLTPDWKFACVIAHFNPIRFEPCENCKKVPNVNGKSVEIR